jgi:hypothetical protein
MQTATLAQIKANLQQPNNLLILLLMFIALLRKLGWLPAEDDDGEFTSLGEQQGIEVAAQHATLFIMSSSRPYPQKQQIATEIQRLKTAYAAGTPTITA